MKTIKQTGIIILTIFTLGMLQSCDDGPMEEVGEDIDRAASNAAESTEDAARDAGNRIEDACEDLTNSNC